MKKRLCFLILFVVFSFLFISPINRPARSLNHSSQLIKKTTQSDNTERTDYVDSNGRITIAADLGYASIVTTMSENSKLERYYDDKGNPIRRYNGYYALLQEHNDKETSIRITYLDLHDEPVMIANGYAVEERAYNEDTNVETVKYYDSEVKPVLTALYGYGQIRKYNNNGKIEEIIYTDASGAPMMTGLGYAKLLQQYYTSEGPENGKVESEYYYDAVGSPVSLSLGQYGMHKEYDQYGRVSVLTYLDADGGMIATNRGYSTVARTYYANGTIKTEQYYDLDGKPFALSEGQYGIRQEGRQTIYLNQNGQGQFNLKNLLYNHSWIVIPFSIVLIALSAINEKKWNVALLTLYIFAIAYMTLLFRENEGSKNSELLWYYRKIFTSSTARADILKNIWLFIPFGAILYQLYPKLIILLVPIAISIFIEGIQYATGVGFCELDDVISNGLGGWIGFIAGRIASEIKSNIQSWRKLHIAKEGY